VITGAHFSNDQVYAEIEGLLADAMTNGEPVALTAAGGSHV
jgi:hypothetical protein